MIGMRVATSSVSSASRVRQVLRDHAYPDGHLMADPYWGVSLSRRCRYLRKGP